MVLVYNSWHSVLVEQSSSSSDELELFDSESSNESDESDESDEPPFFKALCAEASSA